jgi:hypothetical protein
VQLIGRALSCANAVNRAGKPDLREWNTGEFLHAFMNTDRVVQSTQARWKCCAARTGFLPTRMDFDNVRAGLAVERARQGHVGAGGGID